MNIASVTVCASVVIALASTLPAIAAPETSALPISPAVQSAVVAATEEPRHIVRYRSPRFVIYTNNFAPGDWTLYHQHRNDLLAVIAGETVAISQKLGGEPGEQKVPAGTVAFFPYADMPDGYVHRVSVGGNLPFINVGLEFQDIVPSAERKASLPLWDSKAVTLIGENRRGRAYRVELGAGQLLALPESGSAMLLVAVSTAAIKLEGNNDGAHWAAVPGDFHFYEKTWPRRLNNVSVSTASAVLFQAY